MIARLWIGLTNFERAWRAGELGYPPSASADTRPQGGDAQQAPFTSGAVPKADAQNQSSSTKER